MKKQLSKRRIKARAKLYARASAYEILNYGLDKWFDIGEAISFHQDIYYVTPKCEVKTHD